MAILAAIISAVKGLPVPQDIAVTGEISLRGKVKPVGGLHAKIYGAKQGGVKKVFVPKENLDNLPAHVEGVEIVPMEHVLDLLTQIFPQDFRVQSAWPLAN